jgi:hypothetical protein
MEHKFKNLENEIEDRFEDLEEELLDTFRYPIENLINSPFEEFNLFSDLTENTATGNTPPGYSQITDNFINSPLELNS